MGFTECCGPSETLAPMRPLPSVHPDGQIFPNESCEPSASVCHSTFPTSSDGRKSSQKQKSFCTNCYLKISPIPATNHATTYQPMAGSRLRMTPREGPLKKLPKEPLAWLLGLPAGKNPRGFRTWFDSTGRYSLVAQYIAYETPVVKLKGMGEMLVVLAPISLVSTTRSTFTTRF